MYRPLTVPRKLSLHPNLIRTGSGLRNNLNLAPHYPLLPQFRLSAKVFISFAFYTSRILYFLEHVRS
jgi:hypothetical protein